MNVKDRTELPAVPTKFSPAWLLFFLAPVVGELLTGYSPPLRFMNPFASFFLFAIYGAGAVLCRELTARSGRSWPTVLVLGAALVLVKEGLMTGSLFASVGAVANYGRFLGVNWFWLVQSLIAETVFAIAIPILLVNLLFPQRKGEAWLGASGMWWMLGLLIGGTGLGLAFFSTDRPSPLYYLITLGIIVAITFASLNLPYTIRMTKSKNVAAPYVFGMLTLLATLVFSLSCWLLPMSPLPAPLGIACLVGLAFYVMRTILLMSGNAQSWKEQQQAALLTGALAFYVLLAPLKEWFPGGQDMRGMTFVAVGAALLLVGLNWLIYARAPQQSTLVRR